MPDVLEWNRVPRRVQAAQAAAGLAGNVVRMPGKWRQYKPNMSLGGRLYRKFALLVCFRALWSVFDRPFGGLEGSLDKGVLCGFEACQP